MACLELQNVSKSYRAGARVADDGDELALGDLEVHVREHVDGAGAGAVALRDVLQFETGHVDAS